MPFEDGLLSAVLAYERAFAELGLGLALARRSWLGRWSGFLVAAAGIAAGVAFENTIADSNFVAGHLYVLKLPGPLVCAIAGLALALPLTLQSWILPLLAAVSGVLIGLAIGLAAPAGGEIAFAIGAGLGGLWIAALPALLFPPIQSGWARILTRIVGSWLIAIGVMLGTLQIITARPKLAPAPPSPAAAEPSSPSSLPQAVPPSEAPRLFRHGRENDFGQP